MSSAILPASPLHNCSLFLPVYIGIDRVDARLLFAFQ